MTETDPGKLADELEDQADRLDQQSSELEERTDDVRQDWERKRSDPQVAGANPPDSSEEEEPEAGAPDRGAEPDAADDAQEDES
jgi:hypothetical protein